jgi:hypothetical protein
MPTPYRNGSPSTARNYSDVPFMVLLAPRRARGKARTQAIPSVMLYSPAFLVRLNLLRYILEALLPFAERFGALLSGPSQANHAKPESAI